MNCPRCKDPTDKPGICDACRQFDQDREDRAFQRALADNPYAPAPWRTWAYQLKESGIVDSSRRR